MQWMTATVAIAHVLEEKNEKMSYGKLAKAIGMTPNGWKGNYHQQLTGRLLRSLAAVEHKFRVTNPINYKRFVNAATGKPGKGFYTHNEIIDIKAA
jgi:hypothetical protein